MNTQIARRDIANKMQITDLMQKSGVGFGTSGARGRVKDMTDQICYAYTIAFLQHLEAQGELSADKKICIAGDLRDSTPRIMNAVAAAIKNKGYQAINCGTIPSPAVACYGLHQKIPSIMVTGSHIPDDRNGIKFNTAAGEILKEDEEGIRRQTIEIAPKLFSADSSFSDSANYL